MCHAVNIAGRTGKRLRIGAQTETFNDAEANRLVGRTHRKGFELPAIAEPSCPRPTPRTRTEQER